MKPFLHLIAAALAAAYIYSQNLPLDWFSVRAQSTPATLHQAFDQSLSNIQIADEGIVIKILDDDLKGSRHQRFILKLAHGQTVLIAHNIDLSERIQGLKKVTMSRSMGNMNGTQKAVLSTGLIVTRRAVTSAAG